MGGKTLACGGEGCSSSGLSRTRQWGGWAGRGGGWAGGEEGGGALSTRRGAEEAEVLGRQLCIEGGGGGCDGGLSHII